MVAVFPVGADVFATIAAGTKQDAVVGGRKHRDVHNDLGDAVEALEAKVGTGASAQSPAANTVLGGNGAGASSFRQVATGDIAANAVTQTSFAVGAAASPSTTSATYVDITDMSVTVSTTGGDLLVWFDAAFIVGTALVGMATALSLDAAAEVGIRPIQEATVSSYTNMAIAHRFTGVSAASHTVKARMKSNGSATLTANATQRSLLVMEAKR